MWKIFFYKLCWLWLHKDELSVKLRPRSSTDSIRRSAVTFWNQTIFLFLRIFRNSFDLLNKPIFQWGYVFTIPEQVTRSASLRLSADSLSGVSNDIMWNTNNYLILFNWFWKNFFFNHSNFQGENPVLEELSSENPKECDHWRTGERFET